MSTAMTDIDKLHLFTLIKHTLPQYSERNAFCESYLKDRIKIKSNRGNESSGLGLLPNEIFSKIIEPFCKLVEEWVMNPQLIVRTPDYVTYVYYIHVTTRAESIIYPKDIDRLSLPSSISISKNLAVIDFYRGPRGNNIWKKNLIVYPIIGFITNIPNIYFIKLDDYIPTYPRIYTQTDISPYPKLKHTMDFYDSPDHRSITITIDEDPKYRNAYYLTEYGTSIKYQLLSKKYLRKKDKITAITDILFREIKWDWKTILFPTH